MARPIPEILTGSAESFNNLDDAPTDALLQRT